MSDPRDLGPADGTVVPSPRYPVAPDATAAGGPAGTIAATHLGDEPADSDTPAHGPGPVDGTVVGHIPQPHTIHNLHRPATDAPIEATRVGRPAPDPGGNEATCTSAPLLDRNTNEHTRSSAPVTDLGANELTRTRPPSPAYGADDLGATCVPSPDLGANDVTRTRSSSPDLGANDATRTRSPDLGANDPRQLGSVEQSRASVGPRGPSVGRFALRDLHARGGLGEVFKATDTELNREVALKRIQVRFADDPSSRRRFVTEAELTARLDHPGVVPVFGLVADPFGRPCYAMRFIRGESLKDEIDGYYRKSAPSKDADKTQNNTGKPEAAPAPDSTPTPPTDSRRLAFRQLLQRFTAVCQAIAYAHTRKVIHRDIKPANVMVGTFGETLVVDWGLAKTLDETASPSTKYQTAVPSETDVTAQPNDATTMGAVVGTPAYMAPEQAAGRVDLMGPASDVYSLGATLYYILTGVAPFTGTNPAETVNRVQKGEFPPPRQVAKDVPKPLEAVCLKAMATRIEDRYPTAQALAEDIDRWLSDEPVSCYRDPLLSRLARWGRRHPARVAGTISLLLTGFLAAAIILVVVEDAQKQTNRSFQAEKDARSRAVEALAQETLAKNETKIAYDRLSDQQKLTEQEKTAAENARDLARKRFKFAQQAFETLVFEIQGQLEDRAGTSQLRAELLKTAQKGLNDLLATVSDAHSADRQEATLVLFWARTQMGDVYKSLGDTNAARQEYETAIAAAEKSLTGDAQSRKYLAAGYGKLVEIYLQAGRTEAADKAARDALKIQTDTLRDEAAAHDRLALVELAQGHTKTALDECTLALKIRSELNAAIPQRDLAQSHERMADILLRMGKTGEAAVSADKALKLRERVAKAQPDSVEGQRELAATHALLGEVNIDRAYLSEAIREYEAGLKILETLVHKDPLSAGAKTDRAVARSRLGYVRLRTGETGQALTETKDAKGLCEKLEDRGSARVRRALAMSWEHLGAAQLQAGNTSEALKSYHEERKILEELAMSDPASVRIQGLGAILGGLSTATLGDGPASAQVRIDLARNLERIGIAELDAGRLGAAVDALHRSAFDRENLVQADPTSARLRRDLASTYDQLCVAHQKAGNQQQALVAVSRAFALYRDLATQEGPEKGPASGQAQRDLAREYGKWGDVLFRSGNRTVALILWNKSFDLVQTLAGLDPANTQAQEDLAIGWERLARAYADAGLSRAWEEAEQAALTIREKVSKDHPADPAAYRGLIAAKLRMGDMEFDKGYYDKAIAIYGEARTIAEKFPRSEALDRERTRIIQKLALTDAVKLGIRDPRGMMWKYQNNPEVGLRVLSALLDLRARENAPVRTEELADLLVDNAAGQPEVLYDAAVALASIVPRNPTENPREREQKERLASRALQVLKRSVASGLRNANRLQDHRWDVVRDRDEFKEALATVQARAMLLPPPHEATPAAPAAPSSGP